jgi:hypothetical protein
MVVTLGDLIRLSELAVSLKDKRLTKEEKELLLKAENSKGEIQILTSDQSGEFIKVGHDGLVNENDPSVRVIYLEALERLIKRGIVRHESGILFCLTGPGFEKARKLKRDI